MLLLFLDDDVVAVVGIIIIILADIIIILVVKVFFPLNSKLCACLCRVNGSRLVSKKQLNFISLVRIRLVFRVFV